MIDDELIYLYLAEKNDEAFNCLYQRYKQLIIGVAKKIFMKFFTIPLEFNDLQSDVYFIFFDSVLNFQPKRNKTFRNYLVVNLHWGLLKYFKKYTNKNHQILNLSVDYQDYLVTNINYSTIDSYHFDLDFYSLSLTFHEKNVLKLKQEGFCNPEISQLLNLNYKQIDNAWQRASKKIKALK